MKHIYLLITSFILSYGISAQNFEQYRYTQNITTSSVIHEAVVYTTVPYLEFPYMDESNTIDSNLAMDIYVPSNDNLSNRPAVIFSHSGSFLTGQRQSDDMMAFCDSLARRGYVTATIDYRKGYNPPDSNSSIRAVYRALQDGRSAIRFLRAHAEEYGIDPNMIYMAGSSAGAFIALHSAFMNEDSEIPTSASAYTYTSNIPPFTFEAPDLGGLDEGLYTEFDGRANAVINLWGALKDTNLIQPEDTIPTLLIHGTDDIVVPFGIDHPFGYEEFPNSYGSKVIKERFEELEMEHSWFFLEGGHHIFYGGNNGMFGPDDPNNYWDTVNNLIYKFLHEQHQPHAAFSYKAENRTLTFTDESVGANAVKYYFGDGNTSIENNPVHTYTNSGVYTIRQEVLNEHMSWDTTSVSVYVGMNNENLIDEQKQIIFPNPSTGVVYLNTDINPTKIEVYGLDGCLIKKIHDKNTSTIDLSGLNSGIYIIKIFNNKNNEVIYRKIILN